MITNAILSFLHGLAVTVFAWAHDALPSPPGFVADMSDAFTTVLAMIPGPVLRFVPLVPAVAAGLAFVGLLLALGAVRLARRVLSLFTGGGGNA